MTLPTGASADISPTTSVSTAANTAANMPVKAPRPKIVGGINVKVVTGCGNMYVQLGWCNGKLFEVFATLGRGGGCSMGFCEGLTRSVTAGLRTGMTAAEYARQLSGILCPQPKPFPKEDAIMSCPDGIGKALKDYGSLTTEGMIKLIMELNSIPSITATPEEEAEAANAAERIEALREEREKLGID